MMDNNNPMNTMAEMMSKMMGGTLGMGMEMMTKMMPQGLSMMLGKLPKDQRLVLAKELVAVMVEKGCEGLTKEERDQFFDDLIVAIRPEEKAD